MTADDGPAPTLDPEPDRETTRRERLAALIERRLDIPMAVLAAAWVLLVAYELAAPRAHRAALTLTGNLIWAIFLVEFLVKLVVSGRPLHFLLRRWPSALFLLLPALRLLRVARLMRVVRVLPTARVVGSSYRAVGTARSLLQGRLVFVVAATAIVVLSSAQLLFLLERGRPDGVATLWDALWWSANVTIAATLVDEPVTWPGRLLAVALSAYAVGVFAAVAATLGAYFVEARAERAAAEDESAG